MVSFDFLDEQSVGVEDVAQLPKGERGDMFCKPVLFKFAGRTGAQGVKTRKQKLDPGTEIDNIRGGQYQDAAGF